MPDTIIKLYKARYSAAKNEILFTVGDYKEGPKSYIRVNGGGWEKMIKKTPNGPQYGYELSPQEALKTLQAIAEYEVTAAQKRLEYHTKTIEAIKVAKLAIK